MGEEGLHCCPFFCGPYNTLQSLHWLECSCCNKGSSKSEEESGMKEESLLEMGERGGVSGPLRLS